jgi:hypothetical protein
MNDFFSYFTNTETPFALLFIALFFYVIKSNKDREDRLHRIIDESLNKTSEDLHVLLKVWKILIEKEVKQDDK